MFALYFAEYRTSRYDRRYLLFEQEWEIKLCRFDHNDINSPVCCQHHLILFIHNFYLWPRPWPWPQEIGLGLGLKALASVSASRFWPRLTSLKWTHRLTTARHASSRSINLPRRDWRLSWPRWLSTYHIPRLFTCQHTVTHVIHPSSNRARCRAIALIETKVLTTTPPP